METLYQLSRLGLDYGLLLFARVASMTLSSPVFGRQNIPNMAKISYSLALTIFFFMHAPLGQTPVYSGVFEYAMLLGLEMLIGLVMGYMLNLFFMLVYTAGQLIDMQMGFGMANVLDPQTGVSVPMIGGVLNIMMMLVFISVGGFERLIMVFNLTLIHIPIGEVVLVPEIAVVAAQTFSQVFLLAVQMALPIIASGLLGEAIMGMVVRTVPQMNMFVIGMPLKVLLGILMLMFVLPVYVEMMGGVFDEMFIAIERGFAALVGGS